MIQIEWAELVALTPTPDDVVRYAPRLAAAYNDPHNSALLGNTQAMSIDDVVEHYAALQPPDAYAFVLLRDGELAGDGDLRNIAGGAGELAFLIAAPSAQGKGLGTRFAIMMQAFAFHHLGLERLHAAVIPENTASRRVFEKLGYSESSAAGYGDAGDLVLAIEKATFERRHAAVLADVAISMR
jgi:RimJ/RimL family protein N-acetyltransferase